MDKDYNEIKDLLERWNEAMAEVEKTDVSMPADVSDRIDAALEREMAMTRAAAKRMRLRRRMLAASSVAACLLLAFVAVRVAFTHDNPAAPADARYAAVDKTVAVAPANANASDTASILTLSQAPVAERIADSGKKPATRKRGKRIGNPAVNADAVKEKIQNTEANTEAVEDYGIVFDDSDDRSRLLAANYRVVDNEMEASAIISSVFLRLESRMNEESAHVMEIGLDYDVMSTKLYN